MIKPHIIILSENNPTQLYALLESMRIFYPDHDNVRIIYYYNKENKDAYDIVFNKFSKYIDKIYTNIIIENVCYALKTNASHVMFLKDTSMFIRPYDVALEEKMTNLVSCHMLNVGLHTDWCERLNKWQCVPKGTIYEKRSYGEDFSNIVHIGGAIYRIEEFENLLMYSKTFFGIDDFEYLLRGKKIERPYVSIGSQQTVLNIKSEETKEEMLNKFIKGKKIDINSMFYYESNSSDIVYDFSFKFR